MPESRSRDDLIGKILRKAGLVEEEQLRKVKEIQSSLRDRGASISLVSILHQQELISRNDLQTLQEYIDENVQQLDRILPPRFDHPFLKEENLAERALEEGVISEEQYERAAGAEAVLDEHGMDRTAAELLVEQESVNPRTLRAVHERPSTGTAGADDRASETASTSGSVSTDTGGRKGTVMSTVDRNVLEELIRQGELQRSRIPAIVRRAKKKRDQDSTASSPVREVLKEMGLITPENVGEIIDAAMENEAPYSTGWGTGSLLRSGAVLLSAVLLLAIFGYLLSPSGTDRPKQAEKKEDGAPAVAEPDAGETEDAQPPEQQTSRTERSASETDGETSQPPEPSYLMTFRMAFQQSSFRNATCTCRIAYDERRLTEKNLRIPEDGELSFQFARTSDRDQFSIGIYLARCSMNGETPGMTQKPLYAIETYGPEHQLFQDFIYENLWNFRLVSGFGSPGAIRNRRWKLANQLRSTIKEIRTRWEPLRETVERSSPDINRLSRLFRNLNEICSSLSKKLKDVEQNYRTYPYPAYRERLKKACRILPRAGAGLIAGVMKEQGKTVPEQLKTISSESSIDAGKRSRTAMDTLSELLEQLPENKQDVELSLNLRKKLYRDLRILLQAETLIRLLTREDIRREGIPEDDPLVVKSTLFQLYRYISTHVELHSVLLGKARPLGILDEQRAKQIGNLPDLLRRHMHAVLVDLAEERNVSPPGPVTSVDESISSIRNRIDEIVERAEIPYRPSANETGEEE